MSFRVLRSVFCVRSCSAAILAGGKGSRLGGICKALIKIKNGKTLIEHQISVLKPLFKNVFIISDDPRIHEALSDLEITKDIFKNSGPLGGIYAALSHAKDNVFIIACDMPSITANAIKKFLNNCTNKKSSAFIATTSNFALRTLNCSHSELEPLFGLYKYSCINALQKQLRSQNFKVQEFLNNISIQIIDMTASKNNFYNINTPEDLQQSDAFS